MIYLSSPYSSPDAALRERRFLAVCSKAAALMQGGLRIFSPIAHSHSIATHGLPVDWEFWRGFDLEMLEKCSELWVLKLDAWEESKGIREEIDYAVTLGIPIKFVEM